MFSFYWRRIFLGKIIIFIALLVLGFYLLFLRLTALPFMRRTFRDRNLFERPRFRLQQNGDYWIVHDYIVAESSELHGNQSVTLISHGRYDDLKDLEWLMLRWRAPISLAVFVGADDFEPTLYSLQHLKYCSIYASSFIKWVSVQLVLDNNHLTDEVRRMETTRTWGFKCLSQAEMDAKYMPSIDITDKCKYPINLLKNVARQNARTHFIFPLELNLLPTRNFAKSFLQFAQAAQLRNPFRSVFCVPIFPYNSHIRPPLTPPKWKSDLFSYVQPYLNGTEALPAIEYYKRKGLEGWLYASVNEGKISVFQVGNSPENCAAYVSTSFYEPMYDQRDLDSPYTTDSARLQVLVGLEFDFVLLDGSFLLHRLGINKSTMFRSKHEYVQPNQNHIREIIMLNNLIIKGV
ncbi:beta-1,4-glucuronyltransferase 1-like [Drosophila subobscura]|uniref:beta-1,4-glucuronyltransferase 1-like n=1 Tax=Drosophila subobscura TaxID=7241 RepID=UPI00155A0652|nr:beta-1,4-glucuronyltransferase 1-like [Drosophila subobscura]